MSEIKRGFMCIATGTPAYGQMSLNLCLSIRANENWPVLLVCTESAIKGIEARVNKFFHHVEIVPDEGKPPMWLASKLKVTAYDYAVKYFDEIIMIDADTLILPGKSLSSWFDQHLDFVAYYHAVYDFKNGKADRDKTNFWCEPENMVSFWGQERKMPQVNASWIFFRLRNVGVKYIFDNAERIFHNPIENPTYGIKKFRGFINEEPCFNIALTLLRYPLPQIPYRPLYLQVFSEIIDPDYIQHRFKAFSLAGDINHDQRVVSLYNRLSDYYRAQFGIIDKFHFNKREKAIDATKRPIQVYWHIAMMGDWTEVVSEQLVLMKESGLYSKADSINVVAVGSDANRVILNEILANAPKCAKFNFESNLKLYEYPTLELLERRTNAIVEKHWVFYFHTKGVSNPKGEHWRDYLNYFNITKWKDCLTALQRGYDLTGVKFLEGSPHHPPHYSGNYWWGNSEYIKQLRPLAEVDHKNRFNAEMWIASNYPDWHSSCQKMIDHFNHEPFK